MHSGVVTGEGNRSHQKSRIICCLEIHNWWKWLDCDMEAKNYMSLVFLTVAR